MNKWLRRLMRFDFRMLFGLVVIVLLLLLLEGWLLVLRTPLSAYQLQSEHRQMLELRAGVSSVQGPEIERLKGLVAALETRQSSTRTRLEGPAEAVAMTLIDVLDQSAKGFHVALATVRPEVSALPGQPLPPGRLTVPGQRFSVGASGRYLDLAAWMLDFSEKLGPQVRIESYEIQRQGVPDARALHIELSLRLVPGAEENK